MAMFSKILIANRGEIALRVMHTAKAMGIRTVALYSEADRNAQHVLAADEAVCVGPAAASESYLQIDKVIAAAKQTGAEAIHPGYGFLSENAAFSRACAENGIEFIGPAASSIEAIGDKASAKALLSDSAVPLVPGYHGEDQSDDLLCAEAERIGFPVLLKASAGGGGKGMRVVEKAADMLENIISARREGLSSFGDDRLLVEKYLLKPRHVEVQVFCDKHDNGVYLFERDCSVQRRHQKVIEEAPAPGFNEDEALRRRMGEAALAAAYKINYVGAGTVEFLLDERGDFFFMEMNTRLQVEHPVTEMVTDQDLVEWQLRVAAGETLPVTQDQLSVNGHSIEVRVYAEDADNGFLPAIGDLSRLRWPQACNFDRTSSIRVDSGVIEGDTVSPYYDPMIAKLIVWGADRNAAIIRMQQALTELEIDGVKNNRDFLARLMAEPGFINADLSTDFIDRHELDAEQDPDWLLGALVELAAVELANEAQAATTTSSDPWNINDHFRMNLNARETVYLNTASGDSCVAKVQHQADGSLQIEVDDSDGEKQSYSVNGLSLNNGILSYELDGKIQRHNVKITDDEAIVWLPKATKRYARNVWLGEGAGDDHGGLTAPMSGQVLEVNVKAGDQVEAGQVLMIMEAMKMEHSIRAAEDGVVEQVFYSAGNQVFEGAELIALAESES